MPKVRMTISVDSRIAAYLRSMPNASAVVAEAVSEYRRRRLEEELEEAYREDAEESARMDAEWSVLDAGIDG